MSRLIRELDGIIHKPPDRTLKILRYTILGNVYHKIIPLTGTARVYLPNYVQKCVPTDGKPHQITLEDGKWSVDGVEVIVPV